MYGIVLIITVASYTCLACYAACFLSPAASNSDAASCACTQYEKGSYQNVSFVGDDVSLDEPWKYLVFNYLLLRSLSLRFYAIKVFVLHVMPFQLFILMNDSIMNEVCLYRSARSTPRARTSRLTHLCFVCPTLPSQPNVLPCTRDRRRHVFRHRRVLRYFVWFNRDVLQHGAAARM